MGLVLSARCWCFWGHPFAGTAAASPKQGVTALRGRNSGDLGEQIGTLGGLCSGRDLQSDNSATSFIPEDGHFTAWLQAEQGAGSGEL